MTSEKQDMCIVCPTEEELCVYQHRQSLTCPVGGCGKVIKNPSSMKMHMAQTHGVGEDSEIQTFNKAFSTSVNQTRYACPVSTCSRKLGSGRYFRIISVLREHYLCLHAERKHICNQCEAKFGSPKSLEHHLKTCGQIFHCTCGCPFKKKSSLFHHTIKNQHQLPECMKREFLSHGEKNTVSSVQHDQQRPLTDIMYSSLALESQPIRNELKESRENSGLAKQTLPLPHDSSHPSNSYLIILGNPKTVVNTAQKQSNGSQGVLNYTSSRKDHIGHVQSSVFGQARLSPWSSLGKNLQIKKRRPILMKNTQLNKTLDITSNTVLQKRLCDVNDGVVDEKLQRVNDAMQKYVPIMKKDISSPAAQNWFASRRRYTKKKQEQRDVSNVNDSNLETEVDTRVQNEQSSVFSIHDCIQKAGKFLNKNLPRIQSPKRLMDGEFGCGKGTDEDVDMDACDNCYNFSSASEVDINSLPTCWQVYDSSLSQQAVRHKQEQPFERFYSRLEDIEDPNKVSKFCTEAENINSSFRVDDQTEINRVGLDCKRTADESVLNVTEKKLFKENHTGTSFACNQFSLDDLSPELLFLLKNSSEVLNRSKTALLCSSSQTNNQETQTAMNSVTEKLCFADSYNDLTAFYNSDIQTQTDNFSGVLSDAVTQTNQPGAKLVTGLSSVRDPAQSFVTKAFVGSSWLTNNNETQTDNLHYLLTDAFTQTRLAASENQSSNFAVVDSSIADNHTQTNLSFHNFLENLNLDNADQNSLDSSLIPDFADMCTQTNLDSGFDELLRIASAEAHTTVSTSSNIQAESSNCHTQTQLSFDDLFENPFNDPSDDFNADRELSSTCTQTIMDDIFLTDNFTQTQFQT